MIKRPNIIPAFLPVQSYGLSSNGFKPRSPVVSWSGIAQHYFSNNEAKDRFNLQENWQLMYDMGQKPHNRLYGFYDGRRLGISAHFMIGRGGEILQLVPLEFRSHHAGVSSFNGLKNCNDFMIGIENIGAYNVAYTEMQYQSNAWLCSWLMQEYPGITLDNNVGHEHIAPGRKKDPGPSFDWDYLRTLITEQTNGLAA